MTTIYLIRHAQAEGNRDRRFQGDIDSEVSPLGWQQLDYLAERCRTLPVTRIYTSPLKRARETAKAVNRYLGVPITVEPRISEINTGEWEGRLYDELEILWPEERRIWREEPWRFQSPGGESMQQVYDRASAALRDIAAQNPGGSVAVVCHGCVLRNLYAFVKGGLREHYGEPGDWMNNTGIGCVTEENGVFTLQWKNQIDWLPEELRTI